MITHNLDQGRSGNKLFQIAACIGTAYTHKTSWGVPRWEWSDYFENEHPLNVPTENYFQEPNFHFDEINVHDSTRLSGYFQSEKYFAHCRAEVAKQFTFKKELVNLVHTKYASILETDTCAVHVRRTDYVSNPNHLVLPYCYYNNAFRQMGNKTYLIFSDDIDYCKKNFPGNMIFVTGNADVEDFILMTLCKSHIIANSSFSWWGAWLVNSKNVIAPVEWFGPGLKRTHKTHDLIPERWKRI